MKSSNAIGRLGRAIGRLGHTYCCKHHWNNKVMFGDPQVPLCVQQMSSGFSHHHSRRFSLFLGDGKVRVSVRMMVYVRLSLCALRRVGLALLALSCCSRELCCWSGWDETLRADLKSLQKTLRNGMEWQRRGETAAVKGMGQVVIYVCFCAWIWAINPPLQQGCFVP